MRGIMEKVVERLREKRWWIVGSFILGGALPLASWGINPAMQWSWAWVGIMSAITGIGYTAIACLPDGIDKITGNVAMLIAMVFIWVSEIPAVHSALPQGTPLVYDTTMWERSGWTGVFLLIALTVISVFYLVKDIREYRQRPYEAFIQFGNRGAPILVKGHKLPDGRIYVTHSSVNGFPIDLDDPVENMEAVRALTEVAKKRRW